ncbi:MAG: phospholipase D family protein [Paracoccaceae bacterium]
MIPLLLLWSLAIAAALFGVSALVLWSHARFTERARRARGPDSHHLPRPSGPEGDTALDRLLDPLESAHPGRNGLANLIHPEDAFAARSLSARAAGRSLDLIYYIWRTDRSGWLLIADLVAAADRGVRVRLLLDDIHVQGFDFTFLGLTQHPNIEVRLFNPIRSRGHWLRRAVEFLLGISRFNRRMHGKIWIADGRLAILGGRNIGDTYLDGSASADQRAHDADILLAGPLVADTAEAFDRFWNLGLSLPLLALWPGLRLTPRRFRRRLRRHMADPQAQALRTRAIAGRDAAAVLAAPLRWTDAVTLLADPPDKALGQRRGPWLLDSIADLLKGAQHEVCLTTPYLVPGRAGLHLLTALAEKGIRLRLLTNSLASTDLFAVHAAYSWYRKPLLEAGAELHEFAPPPPRRFALPPALGRRRDLLHSKIFLIDRRHALVGSHNFDMRSAYINIELGLLFHEPALVAELAALFDAQTSPTSAHAVTLRGDQMRWRLRREDGTDLLSTREPDASLPRRLAAGVIARLPHDWF